MARRRSGWSTTTDREPRRQGQGPELRVLVEPRRLRHQPALIPYTNDSTHGRAMLRRAFQHAAGRQSWAASRPPSSGSSSASCGCRTTGSSARMMTVYVEVFRNVPLLLWILVALAVFTEITPAPNQFRVTEQMIAEGTEPEATMSFFDSIAITNRGTYVPAPEVSRSLGSFTILGRADQPELARVPRGDRRQPLCQPRRDPQRECHSGSHGRPPGDMVEKPAHALRAAGRAAGRDGLPSQEYPELARASTSRAASTSRTR